MTPFDAAEPDATGSGRADAPSYADAVRAVRTLLAYLGDDPAREGLQDTPERVVRSYAEHFAGYGEDPEALLQRTFAETEGYDEMVVLSGVSFTSHCEHHMVPILGTAHVAYIPDRRVVGISKLARVVEAYARRLQIQERLTAQIAASIDRVLAPRGVAVVVEGQHQCMATRGVGKADARMVTSRMLGAFRDNPATRREFEAMAGLAGR